MKKALLVIDYTYDFVAADGKLTCGEPGQKIEPFIANLIKQFIAADELVIFLNDLHEEQDPYHPETKLFPPHNIRGTSGRDLYGAVQTVYEAHEDVCLSVDKTRYSAFAGTPLHQLLAARSIHDVHLVGVCTDICILHSAVDAYNLGYAITVYEKGVASFNPAGHTWALQHFRSSLGAEII